MKVVNIIFLLKWLIIISLLISFSLEIISKEIPNDQFKKFQGEWVIYRYVFGQRMDYNPPPENKLEYFHKYIVKNPKRWLGKRIIITESKIIFPDKLKIYDKYFDDRECDASDLWLRDGYCSNLDKTLYFCLDSTFDYQGVEEIGFTKNEKYILASTGGRCDETPFDRFFLMNEKDFVFNFAGVFFVAKRKK
jgi:hypothetical protein